MENNLLADDDSPLSETEKFLYAMYCDRQNLRRSLIAALPYVGKKKKKDRQVRKMIKSILRVEDLTPDQRRIIQGIDDRIIKVLTSHFQRQDLELSQLVSFMTDVHGK